MKKPSTDLAKIAGEMAAAVTEALQHEHKMPSHIGLAMRKALTAYDDLDEAEAPKTPEAPPAAGSAE